MRDVSCWQSRQDVLKRARILYFCCRRAKRVEVMQRTSSIVTYIPTHTSVTMGWWHVAME